MGIARTNREAQLIRFTFTSTYGKQSNMICSNYRATLHAIKLTDFILLDGMPHP